MRYRYRIEPTPSNNKKYMIIGLIAVAVIVIGVYLYRRQSDPDPMDQTVYVNLPAAQIPMPGFSDLLQAITSTSPKASMIRSSSEGDSGKKLDSGALSGAMELYALMTHNLPQSFRDKLIPCYQKSLTNPRLALNITKQIANMMSGLIDSTVSAAGGSIDEYPGPVEPRNFFSANDLESFAQMLFNSEGTLYSFGIIPVIIQLMIENGYKSASEVLTYEPPVAPDLRLISSDDNGTTINLQSFGTVTIKSPVLLRILNYIIPSIPTSDPNPVLNKMLQEVSPSMTLGKTYSAVVIPMIMGIYYDIKNVENRRYTPFKCGVNKQPTLEEDVRKVVTKSKANDMHTKKENSRRNRNLPRN